MESLTLRHSEALDLPVNARQATGNGISQDMLVSCWILQSSTVSHCAVLVYKLSEHWPSQRWQTESLRLIKQCWIAKKYTFILKDELLPRDPGSGREQATISYEYDFAISESIGSCQSEKSGARVFIPWSRFKPTYRGKEKKNAQQLNLKSIRRISVMMRRYVASRVFPALYHDL